MNRRNGKPTRHPDRLIESPMDNVTLCIAVEDRFKTLLEQYFRVTGDQLAPPPSLAKDMYRWRTMAVRFRRGDYRNTDAELKSLRTIAQWTVDENCKLKNQEPKKVNW
jgi:hypothetical protein